MKVDESRHPSTPKLCSPARNSPTHRNISRQWAAANQQGSRRCRDSRESQQIQNRLTAAQHAQAPETSAKITGQEQPKDQPAASQQAQSAELPEKINREGC